MNVLLPTDLTIQSLYPVHEICRQPASRPCNVYVIHTLNMPGGIMDLLFLEEKKPYKMLKPQFLEALEMLRQKYPNALNVLSFEFVWGSSRAFLNNYMQGRNIQAIYLLKDYEYSNGLPQSVNCIPSLLKCKTPVMYVQKRPKVEYGVLSALLYQEEKIYTADHRSKTLKIS